MCMRTVTPYVGVWIETAISICLKSRTMSLLMWECGLKQSVGDLFSLRD